MDKAAPLRTMSSKEPPFNTIVVLHNVADKSDWSCQDLGVGTTPGMQAQREGIEGEAEGG